MFKRREEPVSDFNVIPPQVRVTSILGENTSWKGELTGKGGIRIEGLFEGKINLDGLIIVDQKGRVESDVITADTVIVGGSVRSDIQAKRVEIRSTGRVWGDVIAERFSTEEGAYLRGTIQMEETAEEDKVEEDNKEEPVSEINPDEKLEGKPTLKPKKKTKKEE